MAKAIGMIEFLSISKGIETCDFMLKESQVDILKSSTVCPGKYIVIIAGDTSEVKASMEVGKKNASETMVDALFIPNINEQVIPAITMVNQIDDINAIGVIEFYSIASAILAADTVTKSANVTLIEIKIGYAIGGKGVVIFTGDVDSVKVATENVTKNSELLCGFTIIPRPSKQLIEAIL